jgi:hypothetical protein
VTEGGGGLNATCELPRNTGGQRSLCLRLLLIDAAGYQDNTASVT